MTLLISKKNRTFDFLHPQDDSPEHISHLTKKKCSQYFMYENVCSGFEDLSIQLQNNDEYIIKQKEENHDEDEDEDKEKEKDKEEKEKKIEKEENDNNFIRTLDAYLTNDRLKSELKDEIKEIKNKMKNKYSKENKYKKVCVEIPENVQKSEMHAQMKKSKYLVPILPVWKNVRCLNFDTWFEKYQKYIESIFDLTLSYFLYLNTLGYNIKVNERELFFKLCLHIYHTSENVRSNYIFLK